MGKLSGLPTNASPVPADYLTSTQASGPTDVKIPITDFLAIIAANSFNPYKFSAYRAAALSPTSFVTFDTEEFDTGSNYSTSTGRFTAPIAGFYQINSQLRFSITSSIQNVEINLYKNGSLFKNGNMFINMYNGASNVAAASLSVLVSLNATDYLQISVINSPTLALTGTTEVDNYFQGFLVSAT